MSKEKTEGKCGMGINMGSCGIVASLHYVNWNPLNGNVRPQAFRSNPPQHIRRHSQPCGFNCVSPVDINDHAESRQRRELLIVLPVLCL